MLLDYGSPEASYQPPQGTRVAGILDLLDLMRYTRAPMSAADVAATRSAIARSPDEMFRDYGQFLDPRGRLTVDTGSDYVGKPLPERKWLRDIVEGDYTLRDYLADSPSADLFGDDLSRIKVGATADLPPNFSAGYTPASGFTDKSGNYQMVQPGFVVVRPGQGGPQLGAAVEHELTHAYQNILSSPRGTTTDEMAGPMIEYLTEIGALPPAKLARIDDAAKKAGISRAAGRYYSSSGEAGARAAEAAYLRRQGGVNAAPSDADFLNIPGGGTIRKSMLFDIPADADAGFKEWWAKKWKK